MKLPIDKNTAISMADLEEIVRRMPRKIVDNLIFLGSTMEEKVEYIHVEKAERHRHKWVPKPIQTEIDMGDGKEVAAWKALNFKQRYPFLNNEEEKQTLRGQRILFRKRACTTTVYNVDASDTPTVGVAINEEDGEVAWVELININDRVWQEI